GNYHKSVTYRHILTCGNYHKTVTYRHILNLWELPQIGSDHPDNTKISIGILNSIRYLKRGFLEFL
ncbi:hypothetical protein, partial [Leptospira interrogans]